MKRKKNEIEKMIYAIIAVVITIAIISQGVIFSTLLYINNSQKQKVAVSVLEQIYSTVIEKVGIAKKVSDKLYGNSIVAALLSSNDEQNKKEYLNRIAEYMDVLQISSDDLIYAAVFENEGNGYKLTNNMSESEFERLSVVYKEYIKAEESGTLREDGTYCDFFLSDSYGNGELYVCAVDKVQQYNFDKLKNDICGTLIICNKINAKKLLLEMEDLDSVNIEVKNNYNEKIAPIILGNVNKKSIFHTKFSETVELLNTQWDMEIVITTNEVISAIEILQIVLLLETALLLLLILFVRRKLSKGVFEPINKIVSYLRDCDPVTKKEELECGGLYEIQSIVKSINQMFAGTRDVVHQLVYNQQRLYEAELCNSEKDFYALQSQVNPHFLCNALECMRGMALENGLNDVADMSADISEIMRYVLQKEKTETIVNEIDITEKYIQVMKRRYPNSFKYKISIQEGLENISITRMSIQPLVENSFLHGRFFKKKNALLKINISAENSVVYVSIYDNGTGFSKDKLVNVNNTLFKNNSEERGKKGIGLININQRIKYQYGNEYGLTINSVEGEYTEVLLSFPLKNSNIFT